MLKTKQCLFIIILLLSPVAVYSAPTNQSINNTLQELRLELQKSYTQRSEAQQALKIDYERQHQQEAVSAHRQTSGVRQLTEAE